MATKKKATRKKVTKPKPAPATPQAVKKRAVERVTTFTDHLLAERKVLASRMQQIDGLLETYGVAAPKANGHKLQNGSPKKAGVKKWLLQFVKDRSPTNSEITAARKEAGFGEGSAANYIYDKKNPLVKKGDDGRFALTEAGEAELAKQLAAV